MSDVTIKKGANFPFLTATLTTGKDSPVPIDLTLAKEVKVYLKGRKTKTAIIGNCSIAAPATSGVVVYEWAAGSTSVVDDYDVEWEIVWNTGKIDVIPNEGTKLITVEERLN